MLQRLQHRVNITPCQQNKVTLTVCLSCETPNLLLPGSECTGDMTLNFQRWLRLLVMIEREQARPLQKEVCTLVGAEATDLVS